MRYLFVGDSAHAALESSALLGKFDTFALPLFDDAAFELVKRTDERQHKFRSAGDVHPVLKAQTFFHKSIMAEIVCILGCVHSGHTDGAENGRSDLW